MNITVGKPNAISEKGGRLNNEDFISPPPEAVSTMQRLFLVCDGVGGAEKGEIASTLACESIRTFFDSFLEEENPSYDFIQKALQYTESRFDEYILTHPQAKGMATTLTLLYLGSEGVTIAHIGDSRIYQFREGKIINKTEDHSLVNSLYKLGKITYEEMLVHPQKNVITRAIQGSERPTEAEVILLRDIQPGDDFFMCTDGVLECFSDESLALLFAQKYPSDKVKDIIVETCGSKAKDNYSFYHIPVDNVHQYISVKQNILSFLYTFI
ncbi:protein phosphatase 2C domain-containing protein [Parabacteroides sp. OttesenSCG-928-G07]|nr:protein phosphatase 2C domain-containing protein [Parabacteroides sp. OttesenSCG-928-G07]